MIAAMPAIVAQVPGARLLLVGGGPAEHALRAQAEASQAAHAIRFVGRVPHHEVDRYYALADVVCYPRKAMRLTDLVTPLKPLEAMAQGLPVVATDVGGMSEQVEDGITGRLVGREDEEALASALVELASDPRLRLAMGTAGRERVRRRFGLQTMVDRYAAVCLGRPLSLEDPM